MFFLVSDCEIISLFEPVTLSRRGLKGESPRDEEDTLHGIFNSALEERGYIWYLKPLTWEMDKKHKNNTVIAIISTHYFLNAGKIQHSTHTSQTGQSKLLYVQEPCNLILISIRLWYDP